MIRLTLRQFRTEGLVGVSLLVALAVLLAVTGPWLAQLHDAYVAACASATGCPSGGDPVLDTYSFLQSTVEVVVSVAPALVGIS